MKQKHVRSIFGIILIVVMVVLVMPRLLTESFAMGKWDNATPKMRDRLMDGLARSGILVGLPEREVYEMLGDLDESKHGRAMYYFRDEGQSRPCLILSFTRDGNVASESLSSMRGTTSNDALNEETWHCGTPTERLSMVRDLLASDRLRGMSRLEVYERLGRPDRETPSGPTIWYYGRYYDESGDLKKRHAGISRCLYIDLRDQNVETAGYKGSQTQRLSACGGRTWACRLLLTHPASALRSVAVEIGWACLGMPVLTLASNSTVCIWAWIPGDAAVQHTTWQSLTQHSTTNANYRTGPPIISTPSFRVQSIYRDAKS